MSELASTSPVRYQDKLFPPRRLDWPNLSRLLGPAGSALARYDEILNRIPNPDILVDHLARSEAVYSSRIEGTQSSISDVFEFEEASSDNSTTPPSMTSDVIEVLNYKLALAKAKSLMKKYPLSRTVICNSHRDLMQHVRGQSKTPGEFRKIPVWIGSGGIETARFIPISAERIPDAIGELENYINEDTTEDGLVRAAVIHAQFEAVHPFLDGNGRMGRLMIPLYLWQRGLVNQPLFYMSSYLERHRQEYNDSLLSVSKDRDWTNWCVFFLHGVIAQSRASIKKIDQIIKLREECRDRWSEILNSRHFVLIHDWTFAKPVFNGHSFANSQEVVKAQITTKTARTFINKLRDAGELTELRRSAGRDPGLYKFTKLIDLLEEPDEF